MRGMFILLTLTTHAVRRQLIDGVLALGRAHNLTMDGLCPAFFERAREGYNRLLGPDHEKTLEAEYSVTSQLRSEKEQVKLYKNLLNRTLRILGDHELTFDTANELGIKMKNKNDLEASMKYYDIALKRQLRLMGEEHQKTLRTLNNVGLLYHNMENWEKSLEFNRRALKGKEKVLGRTHPSTCTTLMNIANTYVDGLKDYANAEKMYRMALDGREKSFGKGHQDTKDCAKNLARLVFTRSCSHWDLGRGGRVRANNEHYTSTLGSPLAEVSSWLGIFYFLAPDLLGYLGYSVARRSYCSTCGYRSYLSVPGCRGEDSLFECPK